MRKKGKKPPRKYEFFQEVMQMFVYGHGHAQHQSQQTQESEHSDDIDLALDLSSLQQTLSFEIPGAKSKHEAAPLVEYSAAAPLVDHSAAVVEISDDDMWDHFEMQVVESDLGALEMSLFRRGSFE